MLIAIKRSDGGVSLMRLIPTTSPAGKTRGRQKTPAIDVAREIEKWKQSQEPGAYVSHREVREADVPADRTFRDAWTDPGAGGPIGVCMEKARAVHLGRLRRARDEKLKALDLASMRAAEAGDAAGLAAVAARKQALRDLPQTADLSGIETPGELAAFVPDLLEE